MAAATNTESPLWKVIKERKALDSAVDAMVKELSGESGAWKRQRASRTELVSPATLICEGIEHEALTLDVSATGALLLLPNEYTLGSQAQVILHLDLMELGEEYLLAGTIVREVETERGLMVAVDFVESTGSEAENILLLQRIFTPQEVVWS